MKGVRREGLAPVADLSALLAPSVDAIFRQDDLGAIVAWDRAAQRLFGRAADGMPGSTLAQALSAADRTTWAGLLDHVRDGARFDGIRLDVRQRGGLVVPASVSVSPAHAPDGRRAVEMLLQEPAQVSFSTCSARPQRGRAAASCAGWRLPASATARDVRPHVARYLRLRQMSEELRTAGSAQASTGPG